MTWKQRGIVAGVALVALGGAFLAGRYSRPAKIETVTKVETKIEKQIEWRDRIVYQQAKDTARHTETRIEKRPDGTVTTTKVEDTKVDQDTAAQGEKWGEATWKGEQSAETKTVTVYERSRLAVEARGTWRPDEAPRFEGAELQIRALGPFWLGIGLAKTDKMRATASVRAEF